MAAAPGWPVSELAETESATNEPWEPPSHGRKSHRRRNLALVIVAVVMVVILALTGSIPGIPGIFPSHPTNGLSFDSARPIADSMAEKHFASSNLVWATGIANNRTHVGGLTYLSGNSSCLPSGGATSRFVVPAEEGNLTLGLAAAWLFQYYQGSNVTFFVGVINGSAVYYGEFVNSPCFGVFPFPSLPSDLIDSTRAATIAAPQAADFARNYSVSMVLYIMNENTPNSSDWYSVWYLSYETCSFGIGGPGDGLWMGINATTGATHGIYTGSSTGPIEC